MRQLVLNRKLTRYIKKDNSVQKLHLYCMTEATDLLLFTINILAMHGVSLCVIDHSASKYFLNFFAEGLSDERDKVICAGVPIFSDELFGSLSDAHWDAEIHFYMCEKGRKISVSADGDHYLVIGFEKRHIYRFFNSIGETRVRIQNKEINVVIRNSVINKNYYHSLMTIFGSFGINRLRMYELPAYKEDEKYYYDFISGDGVDALTTNKMSNKYRCVLRAMCTNGGLGEINAYRFFGRKTM